MPKFWINAEIRKSYLIEAATKADAEQVVYDEFPGLVVDILGIEELNDPENIDHAIRHVDEVL